MMTEKQQMYQISFLQTALEHNSKTTTGLNKKKQNSYACIKSNLIWVLHLLRMYKRVGVCFFCEDDVKKQD